MRQGRSMEYEDMIARIKYYIDRKKDFFVGGRGVGFSCLTNAIGWDIEIERAAFDIFANEVKVDKDRLLLYLNEAEDPIASFDLEHFLKVQAI